MTATPARTPVAHEWRKWSAEACDTTTPPYRVGGGGGATPRRGSGGAVGGASQLTPLQASERYGVPLRVMYRVFVWGIANLHPPLGKPDTWSVWRARRRDVEQVFGAAAQERATEAQQPAHMTRTADRIAHLRRQVEASR